MIVVAGERGVIVVGGRSVYSGKKTFSFLPDLYIHTEKFRIFVTQKIFVLRVINWGFHGDTNHMYKNVSALFTLNKTLIAEMDIYSDDTEASHRDGKRQSFLMQKKTYCITSRGLTEHH